MRGVPSPPNSKYTLKISCSSFCMRFKHAQSEAIIKPVIIGHIDAVL